MLLDFSELEKNPITIFSNLATVFHKDDIVLSYSLYAVLSAFISSLLFFTSFAFYITAITLTLISIHVTRIFNFSFVSTIMFYFPWISFFLAVFKPHVVYFSFLLKFIFHMFFHVSHNICILPFVHWHTTFMLFIFKKINSSP